MMLYWTMADLHDKQMSMMFAWFINFFIYVQTHFDHPKIFDIDMLWIRLLCREQILRVLLCITTGVQGEQAGVSRNRGLGMRLAQPIFQVDTFVILVLSLLILLLTFLSNV